MPLFPERNAISNISLARSTAPTSFGCDVGYSLAHRNFRKIALGCYAFCAHGAQDGRAAASSSQSNSVQIDGAPRRGLRWGSNGDVMGGETPIAENLAPAGSAKRDPDTLEQARAGGQVIKRKRGQRHA